MELSSAYRPSTSHARLGDAFYDRVAPASFPMHVLRWRNQRWAERVGLGAMSDDAWIDHFGRFKPLPDSYPEPLALRYHGHQFRVYNPEIGDGRGFLFAQLHDAGDGRLLDLGTKGSGRTPWSRTADGRLTLKGGLREILATEMLEALGVNTSKSFSLVETGEDLIRGDEPSPTRSSVMVRLSHSHIRFGSFQRLLYLDETENIKRLLDYSIETYMPQIWRDDVAGRAVAFVENVGRLVARTGAEWMVAGFVHGVLNTDNINITGESFDYGPWRFLPVLEPAFTAAYFDHQGLYAFGRQPDTLLWNLSRLAECFLSIAPQGDLERVLGDFGRIFQAEFESNLLRRLGLAPSDSEKNAALVQAWWQFLVRAKAPFEQSFFDWHGGLASSERADQSPNRAFYDGQAFEPVRAALGDFTPTNEAALRLGYFERSTPCTMLIDEVEAIWDPIAQADDWSNFKTKIADIREMGSALGNEPSARPAEMRRVEP
ncbi:MAG: YdiU family protein [Pseudaminobacter sp.]|nr:YdiU family protein [Pseudaminobacter sp.]